jgi:putative protease
MAGLGPEPAAPFEPKTARYELEMSFSRGLYTGWFRGINNQELAHARFGTKRGVFLGAVTRISPAASASNRGALHLRRPRSSPAMASSSTPARPSPANRAAASTRWRPAARTPCCASARATSNLRASTSATASGKPTIPSSTARARHLRGRQDPVPTRDPLEVHGRAGTPLTLIRRDGEGHVSGSIPPSRSAPPRSTPYHRPPREQLGRLGGTPFKLGTLQSHLEGEVILPVSELNRLRREVATELEPAPRASPSAGLLPVILSQRRIRSMIAGALILDPSLRSASTGNKPELIAVIREPHQLDAAWSAGARTFYCEFENPKHYRDAVPASGSQAPPRQSKIKNRKSKIPSIWVARRASSNPARNGS